MTGRPDTNRLFVDTVGATLGNPGLAGVGVVMTSDYGTVVATSSKFLGRATHLQADYEALCHGLFLATQRLDALIEVRTASDAVAGQLQGKTSARDPSVMGLTAKIQETLLRHPGIRIKVVPLEQLADAENLANIAIRHHSTSK